MKIYKNLKFYKDDLQESSENDEQSDSNSD